MAKDIKEFEGLHVKIDDVLYMPSLDAPADKPQIAVAVYLENSGFGAKLAHFLPACALLGSGRSTRSPLISFVTAAPRTA